MPADDSEGVRDVSFYYQSVADIADCDVSGEITCSNLSLSSILIEKIGAYQSKNGRPFCGSMEESHSVGAHEFCVRYQNDFQLTAEQEKEYQKKHKDIFLGILPETLQSIPPFDDVSSEDAIDDVSLRLYGARTGIRGGVRIDTAGWNEVVSDKMDFSFQYPKQAKIIDEGSCYRIEHGIGFVIFLLPMDGDARCGARTGVGVLPDNTNVSDSLMLDGKEYDAPGFHAIMDTKNDAFGYDKRYVYDFHHMFDYVFVPAVDKKTCFQEKTCMRIGYGIYQEADTPLKKRDIDVTMDTLRAVAQSVRASR